MFFLFFQELDNFCNFIIYKFKLKVEVVEDKVKVNGEYNGLMDGQSGVEIKLDIIKDSLQYIKFGEMEVD